MKKLVRKKTRLDSIQAYVSCFCAYSSCGTACNCNDCIPPDYYQDSFSSAYSDAFSYQVMVGNRVLNP